MKSHCGTPGGADHANINSFPYYYVLCVCETSDLVHARGSEVDANILSVALQLPVLLVCELQVALVFSVCFPPGVFGGVGSLQSTLIKLVLQLTLLELGTVRTTVLHDIHTSV